MEGEKLLLLAQRRRQAQHHASPQAQDHQGAHPADHKPHQEGLGFGGNRERGERTTERTRDGKGRRRKKQSKEKQRDEGEQARGGGGGGEEDTLFPIVLQATVTWKKVRCRLNVSKKSVHFDV